MICCHPDGVFLTQAPSLRLEILSPSTAKKDRVTKSPIHEREGVHYYCLVDPDNQVAKIHRLKDGRYIKQADVSNERHQFNLEKCRFDFDFSKIWPDQKQSLAVCRLPVV